MNYERMMIRGSQYSSSGWKSQWSVNQIDSDRCCGAEGDAELVGGEGFDDPCVGAGSLGEESINLSIEKDHEAGKVFAFHRRLDLPDHGHATHVPDLEIDDDHVRGGVGDFGPGLNGVVEHIDLPVTPGERGEDVVDHPFGVCDHEGQGHGSHVSEAVDPGFLPRNLS
jgi:hypothetical protein